MYLYVVPVLLCKCLEQRVKLYKYEAYEHLLSESEQSSKFNKIEINITFLFCSQLEMTKLSTHSEGRSPGWGKYAKRGSGRASHWLSNHQPTPLICYDARWQKSWSPKFHFGTTYLLKQSFKPSWMQNGMTHSHPIIVSFST